MGNVHIPVVRWSKVKIDTDKDMNGTSLLNLNELQVLGDIGRKDKRVGNVYISGNIYLPITADAGTQLTLDVVETTEKEVKVEDTNVYEPSVEGEGTVDVFGPVELETLGDKGIFTIVTLTFHAKENGPGNGKYTWYEDGVAVWTETLGFNWETYTYTRKISKAQVTYQTKLSMDDPYSATNPTIDLHKIEFQYQLMGIKAS